MATRTLSRGLRSRDRGRESRSRPSSHPPRQKKGRGPAREGPRPPAGGRPAKLPQRTSDTLALSSRKTMIVMLNSIMKVEMALISGVMPMRTIDQICRGSVL